MSDIRLYMLQTGSIKCKVHNIKMNQGNGADYEKLHLLVESAVYG